MAHATHDHDHAGHGPGHMPDLGLPPAAFWEAHYGAAPQVWSGQPNGRLVQEVRDLVPGRALDLGCGEGADAIWLAAQGWQVTAVDLSVTALARAAVAAGRAGLPDGAIRWQQHDLAAGFPPGTYDLVSAAYLLSPVALPREQVLWAAARAVAPGGSLVVLGHLAPPAGVQAPPDLRFPTPEEDLAALDLPADGWTVLAMTPFDRAATTPDGTTTTRTDCVLHLRRHAG